MDSMILIIYRYNELYIIYYISILLHYQWSPQPRDMGQWDTNSKSHSISTTTHSSESWNYRLVGWLFFLSRVRWPRIFLLVRKQIKDKGAGIPLFSRNFALLSDVFANQATSLMFPLPSNSLSKTTFWRWRQRKCGPPSLYCQVISPPPCFSDWLQSAIFCQLSKPSVPALPQQITIQSIWIKKSLVP